MSRKLPPKKWDKDAIPVFFHSKTPSFLFFATRPEANKSHLKMSGWNTMNFAFGAILAYFQGQTCRLRFRGPCTIHQDTAVRTQPAVRPHSRTFVSKGAANSTCSVRNSHMARGEANILYSKTRKIPTVFFHKQK